MAVIQISKIQVRRGLEENLPQLAAGELGWSTDTRRLFIGNGVTGAPDYAPEAGNTEILTVFAAEALEVRVDDLEANVAYLQANVTSLNSAIGLSTITLLDNSTANTAVIIQRSGVLDYSILRNTAVRTGTITVSQEAGTAVFDDSYTEPSGTVGVTLGFTANGSNVSLSYTTTSTGSNATLSYYLRSFGL